jgi:hypothetical protein
LREGRERVLVVEEEEEDVEDGFEGENGEDGARDQGRR